MPFPLNINQENNISFEQYKARVDGLTTADEAVDASKELETQDTGTMLIARKMVLNEFANSGGRSLTPEEANQQYPGMETPFREPVNAFTAQYLYDQQQGRRKLQEKIANGPQDMWTKTRMLGAGIVTHLLDPVEFGVGQLVGFGVGRVVARAGVKATSTAARVGVGALEQGTGNLAENIAQETAIAKIREREGQAYDPIEGMKNVALSTFFGTLVGVGIKEGARSIDTFANPLKKKVLNASPDSDLAIMRAVVGQTSEDIRPDIEPLVQSLARETDVNPKDFPGKFSYNYEPFAGGRGEFYLPTQGASLDSGRLTVGDELGLGPVLTDNPGVANAASVRSLADGQGVIHKVNLEDLKPFNLNEQMPSDDLNVRDVFAKALEGADDPSVKSSLDNLTGKEIIDYIRTQIDEGVADPDVLRELQDDLKTLGFNSFVYDGSRHIGVEHGQHNMIQLFDESLIKSQGYLQADPDVIKRPDADFLKNTSDARADISRKNYVDMDAYNKFVGEVEEFKSFDSKQVFADLDKNIADTIEELDSLNSQGLLEGFEIKELEALKAMQADAELRDTAIKAVAYCVGG